MKKVVALSLFLIACHIGYNVPGQPEAIDFCELSATSRPVELLSLRGTGSQIGLIAVLKNHDSKPHLIRLQRGTFFRSLDPAVQSVGVACNRFQVKEFGFEFSSAMANEWQSQRSKQIYEYWIGPEETKEIYLNSVCMDLEKNPPERGSAFVYTIEALPKADLISRLYAAVDTFNLIKLPEIDKAIVKEEGQQLILKRDLTFEEQIILSNSEYHPDRDDPTEQRYLSFYTINWAIWAVTDSVTVDDMAQKLGEWSHGEVRQEQICFMAAMIRLLFKKAGLKEYALRF